MEKFTQYTGSLKQRYCVMCNHHQDGLETHPGYPVPEESGSQLKENPEQGKTPVNPGPSEQLSLDTLKPKPEENPEQGIIVTNLSPPETYSGNSEWDKVIDHNLPEVSSEPPEQDQVKANILRAP